MAKIFYPDFFNDVFGPIMQPGSSSNFAGMSRIGRIARHTLRSEPVSVQFEFNKNSRLFAELGNMMEDRGLLGGILDFAPDDARLFDAHEHAKKTGIAYSFIPRPADAKHECSVTFKLTGKDGDSATLCAESIGGGMVMTYEILGFPINWQSDTFAVLAFGIDSKMDSSLKDRAASLFSSSLLQVKEVCRSDGFKAWFFELEENPDAQSVKKIFQDVEFRILPALLPVVTRRSKKPQLFKTVEEWRNVAKEKDISFAEAAILYEQSSSGWSRNQIWEYFEDIASILYHQVHSLEELGYENVQDTPLLPIYGKLWNKYVETKKKISDSLTNHILVHAFATNAKVPGVKIVPGPMGTGGGYLFSALDAVREERNISHERLVESLIVAAALGALAFTHTNASGTIGCAGESGVCSAMASGAVTWLCGGDGMQVENAASMALQASIGIPCDPIPGGLEFPCLTRTVRAAVTAPLYADMALAGINPLVPYHEVLLAMDAHYKNSAPGLLNGPLCGVNCTPTAGKCRMFLQELMASKLQNQGK